MSGLMITWGGGMSRSRDGTASGLHLPLQHGLVPGESHRRPQRDRAARLERRGLHHRRAGPRRRLGRARLPRPRRRADRRPRARLLLRRPPRGAPVRPVGLAGLPRHLPDHVRGSGAAGGPGGAGDGDGPDARGHGADAAGDRVRLERELVQHLLRLLRAVSRGHVEDEGVPADDGGDHHPHLHRHVHGRLCR